MLFNTNFLSEICDYFSENCKFLPQTFKTTIDHAVAEQWTL